jgi:hypothetical protein
VELLYGGSPFPTCLFDSSSYYAQEVSRKSIRVDLAGASQLIVLDETAFLEQIIDIERARRKIVGE